MEKVGEEVEEGEEKECDRAEDVNVLIPKTAENVSAISPISRGFGEILSGLPFILFSSSVKRLSICGVYGVCNAYGVY